MKFLTRLAATLALATISAATTRGGTPKTDFSFTTRDGRPTTLHTELRALQPDARVWLLLFDPDCGECRQLDFPLAAFPALVADSQ